MRGRRFRKRQRQSIAVDRLVVVPHRRRRDRANGSVEQLSAFGACDDPPSRKMACGIDAVVAIAADERIDRQRRSHRHRIARQRGAGRHRERERRDPARRDARERAPLANGLAHAAKIGRLQVSQPAVNRLEMIERRGGAEIAAIDERNGQAALRGVVGDRQAVDAAAHHEHVEFAFGKPRKISNHAWISYSRRWWPHVRIIRRPSVPCARTGTHTFTTSTSRRTRRARPASSPISSSIISRSCTICRVSCRSTSIAAAVCSRSDAEPAPI